MNTSSYKEIIDCLKHLIETQDFIVIPDFGALVMQMESAEFSVAQNVLFPPRKKVLFNPLLKHNDGLLISELQKMLNIEFVLAQTMVHHFVQSLNVLLETKRRADIEGIGYFYKDLEGNILFESTLNPFYLSESFGLFPVQTIPVETKTEHRFETNIAEKKKIIAFQPKNLYKAASVLIIAGLLVLYFLTATPEWKNNFADFIGVKPTRPIYLSKTSYPEINFDYSIHLPTVNNNTNVSKENNALISNKNQSLFSIIAGCFRVEQNAKRLLNEFKNKGIKASIVWNAEKQLFVVSVGQFNDKNQASEYLNTLKQKSILKDAWIKEE
ncbi:MAG: SPOR domain-containing protein [Bacteroidota bacterium]